MWLKQCHKPSPKSPVLWVVQTMKNGVVYDIVLTTAKWVMVKMLWNWRNFSMLTVIETIHWGVPHVDQIGHPTFITIQTCLYHITIQWPSNVVITINGIWALPTVHNQTCIYGMMRKKHLHSWLPGYLMTPNTAKA